MTWRTDLWELSDCELLLRALPWASGERAAATGDLAQQLGRAPGDGELAAALKITQDDIREASHQIRDEAGPGVADRLCPFPPGARSGTIGSRERPQPAADR
jgi:hypothetical protein